jgi:hypothetical protein
MLLTNILILLFIGTDCIGCHTILQATSVPGNTDVHMPDPCVSRTEHADISIDNTSLNYSDVSPTNMFEEVSSRWNVPLDVQPAAWLQRDGDIPDEDMSDSYDALTNMDLPGTDLRKVRMKLLCLEWGGNASKIRARMYMVLYKTSFRRKLVLNCNSK